MRFFFGKDRLFEFHLCKTNTHGTELKIKTVKIFVDLILSLIQTLLKSTLSKCPCTTLTQ